MNCVFNISSCSPSCPKFNMCIYNSTQNQLSEINQQLNFILNTLAQLTCEVGINKEKLQIVNADVKDLVSTVIDLTKNDSETTR